MKNADCSPEKDIIVSGNTITSPYKIPILRIPKEDDISIGLLFDDEKQSIEFCYINALGKIQERFQNGCYPTEQCINCNCDITTDNFCYFSKEKKVEFYCEN